MSQPFFKHPLALVESDTIGPGTRVWAWAHVMKGARLGADCNIGEHCFVEHGVVLGDRVTVKNGVAIWTGVTCEDDVFLGPNAVLTNDVRPRSKGGHAPVPTLLRRGVSIGANATIVCGITVGEYSLVGAGTVVTKDVPAYGLIVGNPGRLRGSVCICSKTLEFDRDGRARCGCGNEYQSEGAPGARKIQPVVPR